MAGGDSCFKDGRQPINKDTDLCAKCSQGACTWCFCLSGQHKSGKKKQRKYYFSKNQPIVDSCLPFLPDEAKQRAVSSHGVINEC